MNKFVTSRRQIFKSHTTPQQRQAEFFRNHAWLMLAGMAAVSLLVPAVVLPVALVFLGVCLMVMLLPIKRENWLLREPGARHQPGILYLGNEFGTAKALWIAKEDLVTHGLVLGTTGSGKTQVLLGLMHQFIQMGSGFIFCDGKADIDTWFHVYSMARNLGMEDNLLVINFLAGDGQNKHEKFTNTLNPFASGSSDVLMEIISGFMGAGGSSESSLWRGRAEALGRCLMRALCELRDLGEFTLSIDIIRSWLPLAELEKLAQHPAITADAKASIQYYLTELPSWTAWQELQQTGAGNTAAARNARKTAYEQHGYLTMQFTRMLELLSGTYAHITRTDLGEVDFVDVIVNRRILYIMLPSLEKSAESLKDLGRMVVTSIRSALGTLLGGSCLTGDKQTLLDARPVNASTPYGIFLDEYGMYAVNGFADAASQARSLNISTWFAGQEFEGFRKGSDSEADRILSNTGLKLIMKTESEITAKMVADRAGDAYVYTVNQVERDYASMSDNTHDAGSYGLQKVARITREDLAAQRPGEYYLLYGDNVWHMQAFYGDFELVPRTRINSFIKLDLYNNAQQIMQTPNSVETYVVDDHAEKTGREDAAGTKGGVKAGKTMANANPVPGKKSKKAKKIKKLVVSNQLKNTGESVCTNPTV